MHYREYVVPKKHLRNNHSLLFSMYLKITYIDSAAYIINQAAQILQISSKSDSGTVKYAEKICTAGAIRICFVFCFVFQSTVPIIGIREPTPLDPVANNGDTIASGVKVWGCGPGIFDLVGGHGPCRRVGLGGLYGAYYVYRRCFEL